MTTMTFPRARLFTLAAWLLCLVCGLPAQSSDSAEALLRAAIDKEVVDGDVRAAIKQYQAVVDGFGKTDRASAALALLRMAEAYQRLGDTQSRKVYERLVREFSDQKETASIASARLSATSRRPSSVSIWSGKKVGVFGGGHVSRDGRWLPYTDWSSGNLVLRDLVSGRERQLTDTGRFTNVREQQYAGYSRVSPDGKRVVFGWFNSERYEIRMVELDGDGLPRARTVYSNAETDYIQPFDWAPDGKTVVVALRRPDRSGQIALLGLPEGTLTPLTTFAWRDESTHIGFSPDGRSISYDLPGEDSAGERDVFAIAVDGSRQTAITSHRKDDRFVAWSRDGSRLIFSSDRTGTIQLWAQPISNLALRGAPQVVPSDFSGHAMGVSDDTIYDLKTTYGGSPFRTVSFDFNTSRATGAPTDPAEELFSINARAHAEWSPDGRTLAVVRRDRGGPVGMLISLLDLEARSVRHIRPQLTQLGYGIAWDRNGRSIIAAGLDLKDRRGLFRIALDSGVASRLFDGDFGPAFGIAVSPTQDEIYIRRATVSTVALVAKNLQTGADRELMSRPRPAGLSDTVMRPYVAPDGRHVATVTRNANGEYAVIVIAVESGSAVEVMKGTAVGLTILMWAPDGQSLFVRRAVDAGSADTLRVSVAGSEPVAVNWTLGHDTREFRVHPDGHRVVYVVNTVQAESEVRALTDVLADSKPPKR